MTAAIQIATFARSHFPTRWIASISGSVACTGMLGAAHLGTVTGTLAAARFNNLTIGSLSGATILAGANLGSDGALGGTGSAADTFGPGLINSLRVTGAITDSFIGAGVNPVDGLFGDGDDTSAGPSSRIRAITVKASVDQSTEFESANLPKTVHLPAKVTTATDSRFHVL